MKLSSRVVSPTMFRSTQVHDSTSKPSFQVCAVVARHDARLVQLEQPRHAACCAATSSGSSQLLGSSESIISRLTLGV